MARQLHTHWVRKDAFIPASEVFLVMDRFPEIHVNDFIVVKEYVPFLWLKHSTDREMLLQVIKIILPGYLSELRYGECLVKCRNLLSSEYDWEKLETE